jgi:hypothetical protein
MFRVSGIVIGFVVIVALVLVLGSSSVARAGNPPGTGQPNQSCQTSTTTPGNASSAPGSAFNPNGTAGTHYAGTQPQNSNNPNSVSQYDVACFQLSNH